MRFIGKGFPVVNQWIAKAHEQPAYIFNTLSYIAWFHLCNLSKKSEKIFLWKLRASRQSSTK